MSILPGFFRYAGPGSRQSSEGIMGNIFVGRGVGERFRSRVLRPNSLIRRQWSVVISHVITLSLSVFERVDGPDFCCKARMTEGKLSPAVSAEQAPSRSFANPVHSSDFSDRNRPTTGAHRRHGIPNCSRRRREGGDVKARAKAGSGRGQRWPNRLRTRKRSIWPRWKGRSSMSVGLCSRGSYVGSAFGPTKADEGVPERLPAELRVIILFVDETMLHKFNFNGVFFFNSLCVTAVCLGWLCDFFVLIRERLVHFVYVGNFEKDQDLMFLYGL